MKWEREEREMQESKGNAKLNEYKNDKKSEKIDNVNMYGIGKVYVKENNFEGENEKNKVEHQGVVEVKKVTAIGPDFKEDKDVKENPVRNISQNYQQNQYSSENALCPHILPMIDDHLPFAPKINLNEKKIVSKPLHKNEKFVK